MDEQVKEFLSRYPGEIVDLYDRLRELVFACAPETPEEKLWAKLPSYYVGDAFVRLIPFRDHINIEARAAIHHKAELEGYRMTPKGMVQIGASQAIPSEALKQIFAETFGR